MSSDSKRPCPRCGSSEVFRSHRRGSVERYLLRAIGVRPFRCVIAMPDFIVSSAPTAPVAGYQSGLKNQFFSLSKKI